MGKEKNSSTLIYVLVGFGVVLLVVLAMVGLMNSAAENMFRGAVQQAR